MYKHKLLKYSFKQINHRMQHNALYDAISVNENHKSLQVVHWHMHTYEKYKMY